jgi:hypothetical protein
LPKPVKIDGGAGTNTLTGPNTATTWSITAANAGTLTGGLAFKNVQNLTGGSARDVFRFATGGALGGKISGGSGTNWLDFSPLTTSVVVNLAGGSATHVAGGVSGINNVLGSAVGGDKITGSSAGGILVTHAGHNTVNAGGGRSILIGGMGVNHLNGGASDDLIINGRTLYDGNVATLEAILTVWQNAQTYAQRIAALQAAGSTQLKIGNTVFLSTGISNGTGPRLGTGVFVYESTLRGNGGSDWFFTKSLVTVLDRATGEVVTSS